MIKKIKMLVFAAIAVLLVSCSSYPTELVTSANQAVADLSLVQADIYANDVYADLTDSLNNAITLAEKEKGKFLFHSYGKVNEQLNGVISYAEIVKAQSIDNKAKAKLEVVTVLGNVRTVGIENIVEDENTKLIEEHFKCTIYQFCYFFTRGCIRDDEEDFPHHLKEVNEIKDWKFMFINKKVYDHMSSYIHDGYGGKDSIDLGEPGILKLLGFKYVGEDKKEKRYTQMWKYKNGKIFHSDGTWIHEEKYPSLYHYHELKTILNLPDDLDWVGEKTMPHLWRYLDEEKRYEHLGWILNKRFSYSRRDEKPKTLADKYFKNFDSFGDALCGLISVRRNLHPMSGYFEPHILYLTPQCGSFEEHQKLLEKFAEINKAKGESLGYFGKREDE